MVIKPVKAALYEIPSRLLAESRKKEKNAAATIRHEGMRALKRYALQHVSLQNSESLPCSMAVWATNTELPTT